MKHSDLVNLFTNFTTIKNHYYFLVKFDGLKSPFFYVDNHSNEIRFTDSTSDLFSDVDSIYCEDKTQDETGLITMLVSIPYNEHNRFVSCQKLQLALESLFISVEPIILQICKIIPTLGDVTIKCNSLLDDDFDWLEIKAALSRFKSCDWGCSGYDQSLKNDSSIINGGLIVGKYISVSGREIEIHCDSETTFEPFLDYRLRYTTVFIN